MKYFFLLIALTFSFQVQAQDNETAKPAKKIFVRLYNPGGKIGKGYLLHGTDSIVQLSRGHTAENFPVAGITSIKTRHAGGHCLLIGTVAGIGAGIVAISVSAAIGNGNDNGTASFDVAIAGLLCPLVGIGAGGVAELLRKSETFIINGNTAQWLEVRRVLLNVR